MLLQHQLSAQAWIYSRNFLFTCSNYKSKFKVNSQALISDGKLLRIHYNQIIILNWKKSFFYSKKNKGCPVASVVCLVCIHLQEFPPTQLILHFIHSELRIFTEFVSWLQPFIPFYNSFLASYFSFFYYPPYNGARNLASFCYTKVAIQRIAHTPNSSFTLFGNVLKSVEGHHSHNQRQHTERQSIPVSHEIFISSEAGVHFPFQLRHQQTMYTYTLWIENDFGYCVTFFPSLCAFALTTMYTVIVRQWWNGWKTLWQTRHWLVSLCYSKRERD